MTKDLQSIKKAYLYAPSGEERKQLIWDIIEDGELSKEFGEFFDAVTSDPIDDAEIERRFQNLEMVERLFAEVVYNVECPST